MIGKHKPGLPEKEVLVIRELHFEFFNVRVIL
jgi:hypothetical protein